MDSEKSKVLLKVLGLGSLSAAAEALGYTPSGISRMIATMEEDAGFPLIIRSRKGVKPTSECQELLPIFREMQHSGERFNQLVAKLKGIEIGEITIGTSYRTYYGWLSELVAAFIKDHPGIGIHITDGNTSKLLDSMANQSLDFCIISERKGDFEWVPLQENPLVAWLPADHPMADAPAISLELFATEPYIDTHPGQDTDNATNAEKKRHQTKHPFHHHRQLRHLQPCRAGPWPCLKQWLKL